MAKRLDILGELLASRPLTVDLPLSLERRARVYTDRLNRELEAVGGFGDPYVPYDPGDDRDLAQVLILLCDAALTQDEDACGLASDLRGKIVSREVMNEARRRREERGGP